MKHDQVTEAQPLQAFHHVEKCPVIRLAVIVDLDDVRVRQPRRGPVLTLEAFQGRRVMFGPRVDELDGAGPLQQAVLGELEQFTNALQA